MYGKISRQFKILYALFVLQPFGNFYVFCADTHGWQKIHTFGSHSDIDSKNPLLR